MEKLNHVGHHMQIFENWAHLREIKAAGEDMVISKTAKALNLFSCIPKLQVAEIELSLTLHFKLAEIVCLYTLSFMFWKYMKICYKKVEKTLQNSVSQNSEKIIYM